MKHFANNPKILEIGVLEFLPDLQFFLTQSCRGLAGITKNSKAPEFSGSISCWGLAGDFIFAHLPGLAGQKQIKDNFVFFLCFFLWFFLPFEENPEIPAI